jgi:hypothetical protein
LRPITGYPLRIALCSACIFLAVLLVFTIPVHAAPTIGTPSVSPSTPGPGDQVTVSVDVTEGSPGVASVMIVYSTDNWASNSTVSAPYVPTSDNYQAKIPALASGSHVSYYVVAVDAGGGRSVDNNSGSYFSYDVTGGGFGGGSFSITSTWLWLLAAVLGAMMVGMVVVFKRRGSTAKPVKK